jgi:ribosomal protein S12 methylthiotransferase accessory factor
MLQQISWKEVELRHEMKILEEFVDNKYGIIKNVMLCQRQFYDANMHVTAAITSKPWNTGLFPHSHFISEGTSVHENLDYSLVGSIGESLERYCAVYYDKETHDYGSFNDLSRQSNKIYTDPETFALYAKEQNLDEFEYFGRDSKVAWVEGLSLVSHKPIMVPAQLVYLPYFRMLNETEIFHSTSTGLAFGISVDDTVYSGLMEVIERDAFSIFWLNKLNVPCIKPPFGIPELDAWYGKLFGCLDIEMNILDITSDLGIPSFMVCLKGRKNTSDPFLAVGAATAMNPVSAIKKAIMEAYHTRKYGFSIMSFSTNEVFKEIRSMESMEANGFLNHVKKYLKPVDLEEIDFLYSPKEEKPFLEVYKKYQMDTSETIVLLREALQRLSEKGFSPLIVDVTSDDIAEKQFYSIRTIVPGLHPLWAGGQIPLGGRRIYDAPPVMGYRRKRMEEMNLFPHPFP